MKRPLSGLTLLFLAVIALSLNSCDKKPTKTQVVISHPRANPAPEGTEMGGVYLDIDNQGSGDDQLVAARCACAKVVEVHETKIDTDGMMSMVHRKSVAIPAGQVVTFGPGGLHLMLIGLKGGLERGASIEVELDFKHAGTLKVKVPVEGLVVGGSSMPMDEMHQKAMGKMPMDAVHQKAMGKMPMDAVHQKARGKMPQDHIHHMPMGQSGE